MIIKTPNGYVATQYEITNFLNFAMQFKTIVEIQHMVKIMNISKYEVQGFE